MNSSVDSATLKALDRAHYLHPFTDLHGYAEEGGRIFSRAEGVFIYDSGRQRDARRHVRAVVLQPRLQPGRDQAGHL
jgi:hypothetical protein